MTETAKLTITVLTKAGGAIVLKNAFIAGEGVAGDVAGKTIRISDSQIEKVIQHMAGEL